jgi:hypothetical protein
MFHVLLGKMSFHCHTLLKEGLGSHIPTKETVQLWMNANNARQEDVA